MRTENDSKANEEFDVLTDLSSRLSNAIRDNHNSTGTDVFAYAPSTNLDDIRLNLRSAYEEIARRGYGRVVFVDEYDAEGELLGPAVYRVSQANASVAEKPVRLVARNSPVGKAIASCRVADDIVIGAGTKERTLLVNAIIDVSGTSGLLGERPDIRLLQFANASGLPEERLHGLRAFVLALRSSGSPQVDSPPMPSASSVTNPIKNIGDTETPLGLDPRSFDIEGERLTSTIESTLPISAPTPLDPYWPISRNDVSFADGKETSLGSEFFTRTTSAQEAGIQTIRGLQIVHGIAGSGKTSVALGRLKFFANFRSGENLAEYGLGTQDLPAFDPSGMIGFVLSPSLVSYLKQTAENLDIGNMRIQDFPEFLKTERTERHVFNTKPFKRSSEETLPAQRTMLWLRILDVVGGRHIASGINKILADPLAKPVVDGSDRISDDRWSSLIAQFWSRGPLHRRVQSITRGLLSPPTLSARSFVLRKIASEINRVRVSEVDTTVLEPIERRVLTMAVELAQQRMFRLLNPQDLYVDLLTDVDLMEEVRQLAAHAGFPSDDLVDPLSQRLKANLVTDDDAICALALNALCCDQFDRDIRAIPYLRSFAERYGVFIDEYQDFSELQVLLMGYKARSPYWQVTVSGDASQRLHPYGIADVQRSFPQIATRHASVLLDRNMRQSGPIAALSACMRTLTEEADLPGIEPCSAPVTTFGDAADLAATACERILALPESATVAVICPDDADVRRWFALMCDELDAGFRNPRISDRSELTRRFNTHFTTPVEAKGLEFDAVVVPDLSIFDNHDSVARNALYVAVSRPRYAIMLGCDEKGLTGALVGHLTAEGHLVTSNVTPRRD